MKRFERRKPIETPNQERMRSSGGALFAVGHKGPDAINCRQSRNSAGFEMPVQVRIFDSPHAEFGWRNARQGNVIVYLCDEG